MLLLAGLLHLALEGDVKHSLDQGTNSLRYLKMDTGKTPGTRL